jgi:UDP-N-acetylglucosamine 2-epimerase (non-hydrolysing)
VDPTRSVTPTIRSQSCLGSIKPPSPAPLARTAESLPTPVSDKLTTVGNIPARKARKRGNVRILSVVGSRPQFVKLAPVDAALRHRSHEHVIVHTGQHYDPLLSQAFFDDLAIRPPAVNLAVGSGSHAEQTAGTLTGLDRVLADHQPDWVLVYGDTNATLGGALAAAQQDLPLAHLEAGLRSFDRRMAEERNRIVADHTADLLLAPSVVAVNNLTAEGLGARAVLVGDVMVDAVKRMHARVTAEPGRYRSAFRQDDPFLLATIHRAETTDDPGRLAATLEALADAPVRVNLLTHPRLADRARRWGLPLAAGSVQAFDPLPYPRMIAALLSSRGLVTDSGGLQKEALLLGVPCTTLRPVTEWPETLHNGWNVLVPQPGGLVRAALRPRPVGDPPEPYGDGNAAKRVVSELEAHGHRSDRRHAV